jgi:O-antigen/teichoic acid export membrane protein
LKGLIWYAGLYAASAAALRLAGFAFFVFLARALSVDDYAGWGLVYALQTGLATFSLAGIMESVVGLLRDHRTPESRRRLFGAANGVFLLMAAASIAVGVLLFTVNAPRELHTLTLLSAIGSGALLGYASLQAQLVRLEEAHSTSLYFNFVVPLAGLIGSAVAFWFAGTAAAFFVGSMAGLTVSIAAASLVRIGFFTWTRDSGVIRALLSRVAPFVAVALFGWLSGYGNNYVVARIFAPEQVARFTFAFTLAAVMQLVSIALNQVWSPRFYRYVHESPFAEVEARNAQFFRLQAIVLGAAGGILVAGFGPVLRSIGGNLSYYSNAAAELALLVAGYVLLIPWWHCQNYFLVHDRGTEVMRVVVLTGIAGTIVWIALMWFVGPMGIYVGFAVQMLLRSAGIVPAARRNWPVRISWDGVVIGLALTGVGYLLAAQ